MTKKPSSDRGLFHRRGSPHWWMRYADENGRIVRETTGTTVKKLAREIRAKRIVEVAEGRHLDKKKVIKTTFFELCKHYWEVEGQHKRTKGLKNMIDIWKTGLCNVPVRTLTQSKIERFLNDRMVNEGLSPSTRNRHLAFLSSMFNKGIGWDLCDHNPTQGIPKLREKGARLRCLDVGEIERLLAKAKKGFRPVLVTAIHTGMRRGEIQNLQWSDVNLRAKMITVRESKSGKQRQIPIDDTLYETLRILPSRFAGKWVFPSPMTGEKWTDFKKQFHSTVKRAGIQDFRFHDCRHSFASHCIMAGVDVKTVQELLGHQSLTMTMKYAHLAPDHRTRAIKTLDTALQSDTKTDTVEKSGTDESS